MAALLMICSEYIAAQKAMKLNPSAEAWADSVYNSLTLDERIGQLIFVRANQPRYKLVFDRLVHDYPARAGASLPRCPDGPKQDRRQHHIHVGMRCHYYRVVAT